MKKRLDADKGESVFKQHINFTLLLQNSKTVAMLVFRSWTMNDKFSHSFRYVQLRFNIREAQNWLTMVPISFEAFFHQALRPKFCIRF